MLFLHLRDVFLAGGVRQSGRVGWWATSTRSCCARRLFKGGLSSSSGLSLSCFAPLSRHALAHLPPPLSS